MPHPHFSVTDPTIAQQQAAHEHRYATTPRPTLREMAANAARQIESIDACLAMEDWQKGRDPRATDAHLRVQRQAHAETLAWAVKQMAALTVPVLTEIAA
jgi:hypothetical protein